VAGRRPCRPTLPGEAGARLALLGGAALTLVALAAVHWRRRRLGLDRLQLALVVACLLSAGALLSLEIGRPWHLAWWDLPRLPAGRFRRGHLRRPDRPAAQPHPPRRAGRVVRQ
jgi:hypothetical protein